MRKGDRTNEHDAVAALISGLYWQIDQMKARGVKDRAGDWSGRA